MSDAKTNDDVKRAALERELLLGRRMVAIIFCGFVLAVLLSVKAGCDAIVNDPNETSWLWQALKMFGWSLAPWAGLLIFAFLAVFRNTRGTRAILEKNNEALALMQSGQREAAGKLFQEISRGPKLLSAEVNLNRARLFIEQQRMVDAQVVLEKLLEQKTAAGNFAVSILAVHAEHQALLGELAGAEQSYDQAIELGNRARKGELVYVEALLRLRRAAYKLVADMPDEEWYCAEGSLSAPGMKRMRVLRAFAIRNLPPAQQSPKAQDDLQALLAGARPCVPGEYDYLATRWPELKSFLVESGLAFEKGIVTSSVRQ
jgi:tetratricopeptide (TPR) repeat protein